MTSQRGQLQQNSYVSDMILQQTQQFLQLVVRQDSASKSRIGSSTLTSREIATEKELWSWESKRVSEEICPLGEYNNYSCLQILLIPLFSFI